MLLSSLWDGIFLFSSLREKMVLFFSLEMRVSTNAKLVWGCESCSEKPLALFWSVFRERQQTSKIYFSALEIRIWIILIFRVGGPQLIESQNQRVGEVGRDLWKSSCPLPLLEQGQL